MQVGRSGDEELSGRHTRSDVGSCRHKVAENPPLGERIFATPAIADDTLYVRTAGHLYAFAEP